MSNAIWMIDDYAPEDLERFHRELWAWLAETGKQKHEWPGWKEHKEAYDEHGCFACIAAINARNELCPKGDFCNFCPIAWDSGDGDCLDADSPYRSWNDSKYSSDKKRAAALVRDIPWNDPGVLCVNY